MNKIFTFLLLFILGIAQAQQLNCTVTVDSQRLSATNQQVFKSLETAITEFVNKTDWTGVAMKQNEKINCSMYLTISSNSSDQFTATIKCSHQDLFLIPPILLQYSIIMIKILILGMSSLKI